MHARSAMHAAPRTHMQQLGWGGRGRSFEQPSPVSVDPSRRVHVQAQLGRSRRKNLDRSHGGREGCGRDGLTEGQIQGVSE